MSPEAQNIRKLTRRIDIHQEYIDDALGLGCAQARVIQTKTISLGRWVKLHCQYGCSSFGACFTCPPFSPTADEMSEILMDYRKALLVELQREQKANDTLIALEDRFKAKGMHKAFALNVLPCELCRPCTIDTRCEHPRRARPTLRACGIDIRQTVLNNNWNLDIRPEPCAETVPVGMVLLE